MRGISKTSKVVIANSIGRDSHGFYIIHSPSRWSSGVREEERHFTYYPWELAYLSSLLKRDTDHEVKFIDGNLRKCSPLVYSELLSQEDPDFLIMEPSTRTIEDDLRVGLEVKKNCGTTLIFCGPHASIFPDWLLEKGVDYVVKGEYEMALLNFFQGREPSSIPGLHPNPPGELVDIQILPWPEDEDVKRIEYAFPGEPSSEYREIQAYASRGCLRSCNFCVSRHIYYRKPYWRPRKVEDVVREILYLKEKYPSMEGIFFDEECHNGRRDFILSLCSLICQERLNSLKFEAMCDVGLLDIEMMERMREAGYYMLRVGIESASEKIQEKINKRLKIKEVENKLRIAKSLGFLTYGTFVFGAPGSDIREEEKTLQFIRYAVREGILDKLQVSILTPFPGTPFYEWVKKEGFLLPEAWWKFDGENFAVVSYPHYSASQIRKIKDKAVAVRDREVFWREVKRGALLTWIKKVVDKHGWKRGMRKGIRRLKKEILRIFL